MARNSFTKLIKTNTKDPTGYLLRAQCNLELAQFESVVEDCTFAISLKPNDSKAYRFRSFAYMQLKQFEKGITDYTRVLQLNPGDKDAQKTEPWLAKLLVGQNR